MRGTNFEKGTGQDSLQLNYDVSNSCTCFDWNNDKATYIIEENIHTGAKSSTLMNYGLILR